MHQPKQEHFRRRVALFQFCAVLLWCSVVGAQSIFRGYSNYQIITDSQFDYRSYFSAMQTHGVNLQRIWILGYSGSAPGMHEELPFAKQGNKYDLRKIRPEYIQRMQDVLQSAQQNDQQVMLTLFDHWSMTTPDVFPLTPWYFKNNTERLLKRAFPDFYHLNDRKLIQIQKDYVQQIVSAAKSYHPIYEIMNEAAGANCDVLAAWHVRVSQWIHEADPHARIAVNLLPDCPEFLHSKWIDIVSFHGNEWMKRGICPLVKRFPEKTVIIDTDGAWKVRHDNGLVEKWLTEARSCGGSFNHKDDIYSPDLEVLELLKEGM